MRNWNDHLLRRDAPVQERVTVPTLVLPQLGGIHEEVVVDGQCVRNAELSRLETGGPQPGLVANAVLGFSVLRSWPYLYRRLLVASLLAKTVAGLWQRIEP